MKNGFVIIWINISLVIVGFIGVIMLITIPLRTQEWINITPNEKLVKAGNDGGKYLIFTDDEVFENTDEFILGKFDSSDLYNKLEIGTTYHCLVVGHRVQFLSWYRNIIKCERGEDE